MRSVKISLKSLTFHENVCGDEGSWVRNLQNRFSLYSISSKQSRFKHALYVYVFNVNGFARNFCIFLAKSITYSTSVDHDP